LTVQEKNYYYFLHTGSENAEHYPNVAGSAHYGLDIQNDAVEGWTDDCPESKDDRPPHPVVDTNHRRKQEIDPDGIVETTSERGEQEEEGVEAGAVVEVYEGIGRSHPHRSWNRSSLDSRTDRTDQVDQVDHCCGRSGKIHNCYHAARTDSNPEDGREVGDRMDPL
jgi:hypothetical protein